MSGLILSGWIKRGWVMVALAFGVVSIGVVYQMFGSHMPPNYLKQMLDMIFDRGALLIPCFLLGAAAKAYPADSGSPTCSGWASPAI